MTGGERTVELRVCTWIGSQGIELMIGVAGGGVVSKT